MFIVVLTILEVSLTIWSIFEISKGATFHQLNSLHLKYSAVFSDQVLGIEKGAKLNTLLLKNTINDIRDQPVQCIEEVNVVNKLIMRQIGTYHALDICKQDVEAADDAIALLNQYNQNDLSKGDLITELKSYVHIFNENSALFEKPITKTVSFIMNTMIPLVIFISLFNIIFITYMSRNITGSINDVIRLLTNKKNKNNLDVEINNNVTGELKILLDVAKNKLTEELIMTEVNEKLEYMVSQRTLSLTRANDELALFAYRASHDLKAPLSSSKNLAEFIIQDINDEKFDRAKGDAKKISDQMVKLEELIIGILALTEADFAEKELTDIDLSAILADIKLRSEELLTINNCSLKTSIQLNGAMKSQAIRITQILENLITNGIKYCDQKKDERFVDINIVENENSYIINVEDNGLGIPEERQNEAFQMFKRFHPTTSFGSGLGMAIVKKHIDYMKGTIEMNSSALGTKFTVTLPKENVV